MYVIRIIDNPAAFSECHSEMQVETKKQAVAALWALAKQDVPQFGICWFPMGIEPVTNIAMFHADPPPYLEEKVAGYLAMFNEPDIEALVVQGLNLVYHGLGRHGNDLEFVEKIVSAAREWAIDCFQGDLP